MDRFSHIIHHGENKEAQNKANIKTNLLLQKIILGLGVVGFVF